MTKQESKNGNIKLAVFVGDISSAQQRFSIIKKCHVFDLNYHTDWNELIRIAEYVNSDRIYDNQQLKDRVNGIREIHHRRKEKRKSKTRLL